MGTFYECRWAFMTTSRSILLRMIKIFQTKVVLKNENTHFTFNTIFFKKIRAFMR